MTAADSLTGRAACKMERMAVFASLVTTAIFRIFAISAESSFMARAPINRNALPEARERLRPKSVEDRGKLLPSNIKESLPHSPAKFISPIISDISDAARIGREATKSRRGFGIATECGIAERGS